MANIINFALNNNDVIKAVNFQPVSLVGRMPSRMRERQRITIPGAIKLIEEQTGGVITKEDWFSVPYVGGINKFIEALTGEYKYDLSIHFACGAGSYIFQEPNGKIIPLTRFVDAPGLLEHLQNAVNEMSGKGKLQRRLIALKAVTQIGRYIDKEKQPKSINFSKLLASLIFKHDFQTMGAFQLKSMFIGMMHFQDEYTYDIKRVEKCDIHYSMPDGRVLPFCTFNVFPEVYRDKLQRQYAIPSKEWQEMHNDWTYRSDKYMRDVKALESSEIYKKVYEQATDYFKLQVNLDEAAKIRAARGRGEKVEAKAVIMASASGSQHSHQHSNAAGSGGVSEAFAAKLAAARSSAPAPESEAHVEKECGCGGAGGCGCGGASKEDSCGNGAGSCGCG